MSCRPMLSQFPRKMMPLIYPTLTMFYSILKDMIETKKKNFVTKETHDKSEDVKIK
jgi:hypothetical protein